MAKRRSLRSRRWRRWTVLGIAVAALGAGAFMVLRPSAQGRADPGNAAQVARGKAVYALECAACHGVHLEGQPNWKRPLANGFMPAPPHDVTGHTWHHSDEDLFGITKHGLVPYAPPGYQSLMPAYGGKLSDEDIWAVLAYIQASWPAPILAQRRHR